MPTVKRPLDPSTLEAIAVYIGSSYTGSQLSPFFAKAGIQTPGHDGSTKWRWALEQLGAVSQDLGKIERIILRLASPHEHNGEEQAVRNAVDYLNRLLALEGLEVILDGVAPKLRPVKPGIKPQITTEIPEFIPANPPDFASFISDDMLRTILVRRWIEAQTCVEHGSYLAAIVMMGSILEASLLSVATENKREFNIVSSTPKDRQGKPLQVHEWSLSDLINVANDANLLQRDVKDFVHSLRNYRNMVHPWHQKTMQFFPDKDTCAVCWEVIKAAMNDLVNSTSRGKS